MDNPLQELDLRFSDVVFAIDTTPKSLRLWLQRRKLRLDSDSQEGWRNFSLTDLAKLAIMRKLVDFGVSAEDAAVIAKLQIPIMAGGKYFLQDWFIGQILVVTREDRGWRINRASSPGKASANCESDAKLVLNLENIVRRAFERAAMRGDQPKEGKVVRVPSLEAESEADA